MDLLQILSYMCRINVNDPDDVNFIAIYKKKLKSKTEIGVPNGKGVLV